MTCCRQLRCEAASNTTAAAHHLAHLIVDCQGMATVQHYACPQAAVAQRSMIVTLKPCLYDDTLLQWESEHEEDSVVVLSDVWLDKPETLDRLRTLFTGDHACDLD